MNEQELKTLLKFAEKNLVAGFVVWLLSTAFFLIYEGWHVKATNPIEVWFDALASLFFDVGLIMALYVGANLLINLRKQK